MSKLHTATCISLLTVSGAVGTISALAQSVASDTPRWSSDAKTLRLHMIGNAHVDAPWLWPLSEANAVVHSTFRSALERMKEDPELTMTTSSSQFYEWVAASDPAMMDEIRAHVRTGRWNLVGGWWVEPDINIPSGESLIRQGLYGQQSLQRIFGRHATVGYNPDSFGHAGSLPQILKLQGLKQYVFMRPNAIEKPDITQNLFQWKGIDGTEVLTYRIPLFYDDPGNVRGHMERTVKALEGQPERTDMEFFGIGDHGGGPTKENIRSIRLIQKESGAPKIFYSTPEKYFSEVANDLPKNIQVYAGDLQHHSVGTYTAGSEIKKLNRKTEAALLTAEKFAALGSLAWGVTYPHDDLTKAWERVLLLQFHDSMAATTLPDHAVTARDGYGFAQDVATETLMTATQRLAWQVPTTDPDSKYLVVFNPHSWAAKQMVEYDMGWKRDQATVVEDETGRALPFQFVDATAAVLDRLGLVAEVEVPAFGYRQIRMRKVTTQAAPQSVAHATSSSLENQNLRVDFLPGGGMHLRDKTNAKDVFASKGFAALVIDDPSDTWSHKVKTYDQQIGQFQRSGIKVVEDGPLRARVRESFTYEKSTMNIDWILYAGGHSVEARVELDWHEHLKLLKFSFPANVSAPKATYEVGYGAMERPTTGQEDPGQRWVDVGDESYGLALINDAKYGYSVNGGDLRLSVVRGAVFANHEPKELQPGVDYHWMDQGVQTFRMELLPHTGPWQKTDVVQRAAQLVTEVPIVYQGIHPGTRAGAASFVSIDSLSVIVEAVKAAEDGSGVILRCYESKGQSAHASLGLNFLAKPAQWQGRFHPYEIKTLHVSTSGEVREVNALEE